MTTKNRVDGMNLRGVPSVIVVMALWRGNTPHILGVFSGEDRKAKATDAIAQALSADSPRAEAWIAGDFFVQ